MALEKVCTQATFSSSELNKFDTPSPYSTGEAGYSHICKKTLVHQNDGQRNREKFLVNRIAETQS